MWTLLYRAAWSAASLAAPLLASGDGKLARSIRGRRAGSKGLADWATPNRDTKRPLVWFHAASVGEGRQAEAVLVRLRAERPGWQIVYTHSSASAERFAATLPADYAGYVPADTVDETGRALDAVRPTALVFSATDVWPELVRQAASRGVRTALISATLAPTSSRRRGVSRLMLRDTFATLDAVAAIGEEDAEGLVELGVRKDRIVVAGDTRHDAADARAKRITPDAAHLRALQRADAPILVAGSTWPADERQILEAIAKVRKLRPLSLVIAPHEPDEAHLADLERRVRAALGDVAIVRLSTLEQSLLAPGPWPLASFDVCLVDRTGILAELYAAATVAYVGGGFGHSGLHSVIEPAALGKPVLFGPYWHSSRDARLLLDAGGGVCTRESGALASMLTQWLDDDEDCRHAGIRARQVVERGLGASERALEMVLDLVERSAKGNAT